MTTAEAVLPSPLSLWAARDWAIAHHFDGHVAMYDSIRAASLLQFRSDIDFGDAACRRFDRAALCRHAHSLKGVLLLLGATAAADHARTLEVAAAGDRAEAGMAAHVGLDLPEAPADTGAAAIRTLLPLWHALRSAVLALS